MIAAVMRAPITETETKEQQLVKAAFSFKIDKVKELLKLKPDPNAKDEQGIPALHYAVSFRDDPTMAAALLDARASVNLRDLSGCSALHKAALRGFVNCTKLLLERGAQIAAASKIEQLSSLHLMMQSRHHECLPLFLEREFNLDTRDARGRTALHAAAGADNLEGMMLLASRGASLHVVDSERNSLLHAAASCCSHACMAWLLKAGADAMAPNRKTLTPFQVARKSWDCTRCVDIFVQASQLQPVSRDLQPPSMLLCRDSDEESTALHAAVLKGDDAALLSLLQAGADVNATDFYKRTALHAALHLSHPEAIARLISMPAQRFDIKDVDGITAARMAVTSQNVTALGLMLATRRVNVNEITYDEYHDPTTLVHLASSQSDPVVLRLLLGAKADVNGLRGKEECIDKHPLEVAIAALYVEVVQALLDHDPDLKLMTSHGISILEFARDRYASYREEREAKVTTFQRLLGREQPSENEQKALKIVQMLQEQQLQADFVEMESSV